MTMADFRDAHVDVARVRAAIAGCVTFDRLETRGLLDAMLARHSWLKKYLPGFLRLPFQGGDGTEALLEAIAHARACYAGGRPVGTGAPTQFVKGFWAKALELTMVRGSSDGRVWELALAFETDGDRVQLQLNRGEGRHALSKRLFFGNDGVFRTGEVDELMNKVSALSVLSNAVLVWNTVKMAGIIAALEASSGKSIPTEDLARVSPLLSARLLVSGRYNFDGATAPGSA